MAYNFRLESLLRVRIRLKEVAEAELSRATAILQQVLEKQEILMRNLNARRLEMADKISSGVVAKEYQWIQEQISILEGQYERTLQERSRAEESVEKARHALAERHRDVELLEKFRERDFSDYLGRIMKQEQVEADDMASIRFVMNRGENEALLKKQ